MSESTVIQIILDRSGSMSKIENDVIGGFNKFIQDQKKEEGQTLVTLSQFDHEFMTLYNLLDINEVPELTKKNFIPRGMTSLLDAIGRSITNLSESLESFPIKPDNVVVVIITDGEENNSCEWTNSLIKELISKKESEENWEFTYLGADQDAFTIARRMGIDIGKTFSWSTNPASTRKMFGSLSKGISKYRSTKVLGYSDDDS